MKKSSILFVLLLSVVTVFSQKLNTRSGEIKFEASMPALEEVAAKTNSASCVLDQSSGDIAALVLVKSFKFKVPLMEEHFNENYIESSKFPKATFKGKIVNYDKSKTGKTTYDLEGDLTIHGVTKKVKTKITTETKSGKVEAKSSFSVKAEDYKIEIPNLVKNKIAKNITIDCLFSLAAK